MERRFTSTGHLVDSGILGRVLTFIVEEGVDYEILSFEIGKKNEDQSSVEIEVRSGDRGRLDRVAAGLVREGFWEGMPPEAAFAPCPRDASAPDDFFASSNHRTEVWTGGSWKPVASQRMDGMIVRLADGSLECRILRDLKAREEVLVGDGSVREFPPFREREADEFGFMLNDVSSERSAATAVAAVAADMRALKAKGDKIVVVAGPVVVHTGGADALAALIRGGWIGGVLSGNALAVHDIESRLYGTSLGVDLATGRPSPDGHRNHLRAINRVNYYGSIVALVESGELDAGVMYELVKRNVPYCLAGSIRDDGPLPETETDMVEAQRSYARILKGASMTIMLSSMLHSIGTGNMLPSWVKTVCVDINPAVVTKLSDRGTSQAIGIVSDVGLFLRALAEKLEAR